MFRRSVALALHRYNFSTLQSAQVGKTLQELLAHDQARLQLGRAVNILPSYLSKDYTSQFCQHQQFQYYLELAKEKSDFFDSFRFGNIFSPRIFNLISNGSRLIYLQAFLNWLFQACPKFDLHLNDYMLEFLDVSTPQTWFEIKKFCGKRTFIYHHGPTNSGKSTSAVQELKNLDPNQKGVYMAPLRLLAWEYQQKLGNCSLVTGQQKEFKNSNLMSCTIETLKLQQEYQVAVIDEIQMIGNSERGWAWTKAIIALKAKRIHLCGDQRAIGLVCRILTLTDDALEQRRYSRLSKLILVHKVFQMEDITPGDCIIRFSMRSIIKIRNQINSFKKNQEEVNINQENQMRINNLIEEKNKKKGPKKNKTLLTKSLIGKTNQKQLHQNHVAIVYGRLPSECRKEQAKSFNEFRLPYLVATNAIGMGLNLNIRRVIFHSIERKNSEGQMQILDDHQIQQIAGRAGRGKENGYVQCYTPEIFEIVKKALAKVNQTYGLNLQTLQDQDDGLVKKQGAVKIQMKIEKEKEEKRINIQQLEGKLDEKKEKIKLEETEEIGSKEEKKLYFSPLLNRNLSEKQCKIKRAGLYFKISYIEYSKHVFSHFYNRPFSYFQSLSFLLNHTKINKDLYFLQDQKTLLDWIEKLEQYNLQLSQMFHLAFGLSFIKTGPAQFPRIRRQMEQSQKQMIDDFVRDRKVGLPKILIQHYRHKFGRFNFMDHMENLQHYFNLLDAYMWLWNKFQFAFYEITIAKQIKIFLTNKINDILERNEFLEKNEKIKQIIQAKKKEQKKKNGERNFQMANQVILEKQIRKDDSVKEKISKYQQKINLKDKKQKLRSEEKKKSQTKNQKQYKQLKYSDDDKNKSKQDKKTKYVLKKQINKSSTKKLQAKKQVSKVGETKQAL